MAETIPGLAAGCMPGVTIQDVSAASVRAVRDPWVRHLDRTRRLRREAVKGGSV